MASPLAGEALASTKAGAAASRPSVVMKARSLMCTLSDREISAGGFAQLRR